jgi:Family of unknown function (DUF6247)
MGDVSVQVEPHSAQVRRVEKTPAAIRAALPGSARLAFDQEFRAALTTAADTFDMTALDRVMRTWWTEALLCANPEVQAEVDQTRRRIAAGDPDVFAASKAAPDPRG